jgi:hypothetical protein
MARGGITFGGSALRCYVMASGIAATCWGPHQPRIIVAMTSPLRSLTAPATARIRALVLGVFLCGRSGIDYDAPAGDAGLFGPDSITWRIPCMLSGGLCAQMLQCLNTPYDIA